MAPIPAGLIARGAAGLAGLSIAAGAVALVNGIVGSNAFNPTPKQNIYTTNNLTQFPYDLPTINGQMFCILFQFYKYNRPSILNPPTLVSYGGIALPLPSDLIDQTAISYSEETSGAAISAGLEAFNAGPDASVSTILSGFAHSAAATSAQAGFNALNNVTTTNVGDSSTAARLLQFAGVSQNPFLSVQLNAPTYKRHTYSWTFIPETADDVEKLNYIKNKFLYHSLAGLNTSSGGLLLNYPDMCVPVLFPQGYMYDHKQCVVEAMDWNFAPGNTPAFNVKNAPNAIKFTVKLLEIEYWLKEDLLNATVDFGTNGASNAPFGQSPYGSAS